MFFSPPLLKVATLKRLSHQAIKLGIIWAVGKHGPAKNPSLICRSAHWGVRKTIFFTNWFDSEGNIWLINEVIKKKKKALNDCENDFRWKRSCSWKKKTSAVANLSWRKWKEICAVLLNGLSTVWWVKRLKWADGKVRMDGVALGVVRWQRRRRCSLAVTASIMSEETLETSSPPFSYRFPFALLSFPSWHLWTGSVSCCSSGRGNIRCIGDPSKSLKYVHRTWSHNLMILNPAVRNFCLPLLEGCNYTNTINAPTYF